MQKKIDLSRLFLLFMAVAAMRLNVGAQTSGSYTQRYEALIENKSHPSEAERLQELFKIRWEYSMTE